MLDFYAFVCMCLRVCVHVCVCACVCVDAQACVCVCVCTGTSVCVCVYEQAHLCAGVWRPEINSLSMGNQATQGSTLALTVTESLS